jgi:hypothetical protein
MLNVQDKDGSDSQNSVSVLGTILKSNVVGHFHLIFH